MELGICAASHFFMHFQSSSSRFSYTQKTFLKFYLKFKRIFLTYFLSLFIKLSYLHGLKPAFWYWWHLHTNTLRSAAPLIYHVFNVEQDQVARDNKFDIRAGMARDGGKQKPVKVMNCLANALDGTHRLTPLSSSSFWSHLWELFAVLESLEQLQVWSQTFLIYLNEAFLELCGAIKNLGMREIFVINSLHEMTLELSPTIAQLKCSATNLNILMLRNKRRR